MTQMTESAAAMLPPARAAELVRVLDLQARWENLRVGNTISTAQLHGLQQAFEAYRASQAAFAGHGDQVPELTPGGPDRLGRWCRTVRAVCQGADPGGYPGHLMAKAYHLADRIARRAKADPPARGEAPADREGAARQLGEIAAWCDAVGAGGSHEVGG